MQLSAPTVHEMVGRLERDGCITRGPDKVDRLHRHGAEHAEDIVRRHRLIERFLTDVLGMPWDEVHAEAERLEHAMSPVLEERMLAAIGDANTCPHGHPILRRRARWRVCRSPTSRSAPRCASCASRTRPRTCCTTSKASGIEPGLDGTLVRARRRTGCSRDRRWPALHPTPSVAETVSVIADPSPPPRTALPEQLVLGTSVTVDATSKASARRETPVVDCSRSPRVGKAQRVLAALDQKVACPSRTLTPISFAARQRSCSVPW